MNTLMVSTFTCTFEVFEKFVADFHEKEDHKYVKEYELIKVNDGKSHLILEVTDLERFGAAISSPEMKESDKANGYKDTVYALNLIN